MENALYKNYKMHLLDEVSRGKPVQAVGSDDTAPVTELITATLKHIKTAALEKIDPNNRLQPDDILWVITVPAIWKDAAKLIMRQCAEKAGLCSQKDTDSLIFAYEPEAGALDCIYEQSQQYTIGLGEKIWVFDLGGGTADFSESLGKPEGGPWGSTMVNQNFENFMIKTFGEADMMALFKTPEGLALMDSFDTIKKITKALDNGGPRFISFNPILIGKNAAWMDGKLEDYNKSCPADCKMVFGRNMLKLPMALIRSFFTPLLNKITDCAKKILRDNPKEMSDIKYIFMIGGFSESFIVQEHIKEVMATILPKTEVIIPQRPGLAVVTGACRLGLMPKSISKRPAPNTYIIEVDEPLTPYNRAKYAKGQIVKKDGKEYVSKVCDVYVSAGTVLGIDQTISKRFVPSTSSQTTIVISAYTSDLPSPTYTTDYGVQFLGDFTMTLPNPGFPVEERAIDIDMKFGGTEIIVEARSIKTGKTERANYNLITTREEAQDRLRRVASPASNNLAQLAIIMDITGSMGLWLAESKKMVSSLFESLKEKYAGIDLEVAFVGYRDHKDSVRFEICQFTSDVSAVEKVITPIVACGGDDTAEDVAGALNEVLKLIWKNGSKSVAHIADAPAHGSKYHNLVQPGEDSYPEGDPNQLRPEDLLKEMRDKSIDYYFIRIHGVTDKMIDVFRTAYDNDQKKILVENLGGNVGKLLPSLISGLSQSSNERVEGEIGALPPINRLGIPKGGSLEYEKTLTQIMLTKTGEFVSFGQVARHMALTLDPMDNALYKNYKMHLLDEVSRGKPVQAVGSEDTASVTDLITATLKHIKKAALEKIDPNKTLDLNDILWVITVPAIWNDAAKLIMRQCAEKAGICSQKDTDSLIFAYEPEAGALDCIYEQSQQYTIGLGEKIWVFDLGGGTADFSESLGKPEGGPWGSTMVNQNFENFMIKTFGEADMLALFKTPEGLAIMDNFDTIKKMTKALDNGGPRFITFNPLVIGKNAAWMNSKLEDYNKSCPASSKLEFGRNMLKLPMALIRSFFTPLLNKITDCAKKILKDNPKVMADIKYIFMIGGFSESFIVQEHIKEVMTAILPKTQIIIPQRPGLAVVTGACRLGLMPKSISKRPAPNTYIIEVDEPLTPYNRAKYAKGQIVKKDGKEYISNVCDVYVSAGTVLGIDETISKRFVPSTSSQGTVAISVYTSDFPSPTFTTDYGVQFLGDFTMNLPNPGFPVEERAIDIDMKFGGTEIIVEARSIKTGKTERARSQLAILMDITGSMDEWLNEVKGMWAKLFVALRQKYNGLDLEVAFVGYRDHENDLRGEFQTVQFTNDVPAVERFIMPILAGGGDDCAEDVAGGLNEILRLNWKAGSKTVVHIADAPPHPIRCNGYLSIPFYRYKHCSGNFHGHYNLCHIQILELN
eukprot:gene10258-11961_t